MNVRFTPRRSTVLLAALSAILGGCASTPDRIQELEAAQALVAQVEVSPRAGVAAANVSEARKSLDRAIQAADRGALGDAKFHANVAAAQAQIANEKILTAQAQESLAQGAAERERVLAEARTREADIANQQADAANQQANAADQRAAGFERQAQDLEEQLKDLQARKTDRGLVLTLGDVLFDTGKARLKAGAYSTIDRLANALKEVPTRSVVIEGHTDSMGSEDYNQELSEQRAMSVQSALMQRGVQGSQISTAGKGEGLPVASNDTAGGRQQNRRVEVIFSESPPAPRVATDTD
jgi:outer membrane protein OmpA-like peptidoglycan-associated protein